MSFELVGMYVRKLEVLSNLIVEKTIIIISINFSRSQIYSRNLLSDTESVQKAVGI